MGFSIRITNAERLQQELGNLSTVVSTKAATDAAVAGGETLIQYAKINIIGNFTMRTWKLYESMKVVITRAGYVRAGSYGNRYAAIQEFGGTITPTRKHFLSWVGDDGVMRFARSVTIPSRPFLRPAYDEHKDDIIKAMSDVIVRYLATV